MWIVTGAMLLYFPEYRGLMNGYFQQEKTSFDAYLVAQGRDPLQLLWWSRLIQTLINVALWLVAFWLLRRLLDEGAALAILLLASFAPYPFGQSRMLNHESMVALFSLIAILGMAVYLLRARRPAYLILSALAAALANLTKSSSLVLVPVIASMLLFWAIREARTRRTAGPSIRAVLGHFLGWLALAIAFYVLFWPGMWVAPGKMLHEVYGNALSYAFQGARLSVTTAIEPSSFALESATQGIGGFLTSIAWRTTPLTWIGLLLALLILLGRRQLLPRPAMWLTGFLLLEAFASVAMFGLIRGRNSPHYVLAAHVCIEVVAALGWVYALRWLGSTLPPLRAAPAQVVMLALVLAAQAAGLPATRPYYYTYYNPILRAVTDNRFPLFFYGERMEQAADYLDAKPQAEQLTALVYFGRSFSYHFRGETTVLKPVFFEDREQLLDNLRQADYLVVYTGLEERMPVLAGMQPEEIIYLNDREYVDIYRLADQPPDVFQ
jgi:hypothetical protein